MIDAVTNTKITSAAFPFDTNSPGNIINVASGTGFTVQSIQIVSVTAGVATCDKSVGTLGSTGGVGNLGGAHASPGYTAGLMVSANHLWIKQGTYSITSGTANISGGRISLNLGGTTNTNTLLVQGYDVTRGDFTANRVILSAAVNSIVVFTIAASPNRIANITIDRASATGIDGFNATAAGTTLFRCKANANNSYAFKGVPGVSFANCEVNGGTSTNAFDPGGANLSHCVVLSHTGTQDFMAQTAHGGTWSHCASISGVIGFNSASTIRGVNVENCIAVGASSHGFNNGGTTNNGGGWFYINNIAYSNTGTGFLIQEGPIMLNNAAGANGTNFGSGILTAVGNITLTADPFTNSGGNDFSLNTTSGGGALLRAAGYFGAFPATISTTSFADVGIAQHADPAASGGGTQITVIGTGQSYLE